MSETTPRFALPLLQAGQAQKEIDHNEALALLDGALHALVTSVGGNDPPGAPAAGAAWIVGAAPTGAWTGKAQMLALWTGGGWRFLSPPAGMSVWNAAAGRPARWSGSAWLDGEISAAKLMIGGVQVVGVQQSAIAGPSGGITIDTESRTALAAILFSLRAHGLIAT